MTQSESGSTLDWPSRLLICACLVCSGCTKSSGEYYFIDFSDSTEIKTLREGNVPLTGLSGDRPFPLLSEYRDDAVIIIFEVPDRDYSPAIRISASDANGNQLLVSPVEKSGPCHLFRTQYETGGPFIKFVRSACDPALDQFENSNIEITIDTGSTNVRRYVFPFKITRNGNWTVYDSL